MVDIKKENLTQDEHDILNQCRKGNKHAYRLIIEKYKDTIYSTVLRFTHDHTTAEEITQETFVKAWQNLNRFEGRSKFSTWLIAIAVNKAKDVIKDKHRTLNTLNVDTVTEGTITQSYDIKPPEELIMDNELGLQLKRFIDELPDIYREAFILRHVDLLSYEEISVISRVSVEAVKMRVFRAREILKERFYREEKNG
ncbi:MAG: RNA polymerase sigma factor [bacterium]